MKDESNPVNISSPAHLVPALNEHYELYVMAAYECGIEFTIARRHSLMIQRSSFSPGANSFWYKTDSWYTKAQIVSNQHVSPPNYPDKEMFE